MSIYAVNKLCREALRDVTFRAALKRDPQAAIASLSLTDEERAALLRGDVAWLYARGCASISARLSHALGVVRAHRAALQRANQDCARPGSNGVSDG
jgi:hypothetical protein